MEIVRGSEINHRLPSTLKKDDYPYALSGELFSTPQLFVTSERLRPGTKASSPHYHRTIDEIAYITKGEVYACEGDREVLLKAGDSILFSKNSQEFHFLENRSEDEAEFILIRRKTRHLDVIYPEG